MTLHFHIKAPWQEYGEFIDPNTFLTKIGWYKPIWLFFRRPDRGWTLTRCKRPM